MKVPLNLTVPPDVKKQLEECAKREERSVSAMATVLLRQAIAHKQNERAKALGAK